MSKISAYEKAQLVYLSKVILLTLGCCAPGKSSLSLFFVLDDPILLWLPFGIAIENACLEKTQNLGLP